MAEKFAYMSPYQFTSNNPVSNVDLDGLEGVNFNENTVRGLVWGSIGFNHKPGPEESRQIATNALVAAAKVTATGAIMVAPVGEIVEGAAFGLAGLMKTADEAADGAPVIQKLFNDSKAAESVSSDLPQPEPELTTPSNSSTIEKLNPHDLNETHGLTQSNNDFAKFKANVKENGIKEPIKYSEHNGQKFVVDGHHRLRAAKQLGHATVPAQKVDLPFGGYQTTQDFIWTRH